MDDSLRYLEFMRRVYRYDPHLVMEDLGVGSVFFGDVLCVAATHRGIGLGTALLLQSMRLAEERERCQAYFAGLSSVYSQRIFLEQGFGRLRELAYADMKDCYGAQLLTRTGEHRTALAAFKMLKKKKRTDAGSAAS